MSDVKVENMNMSYNDLKVLNNFSYTFEENTATCLTGCSGCGKTTLLHIIMGLIKPDSGRITGITAESGLAVVFQEDRLCENLDAITNVWLTCGKKRGKTRGKTRSETREKTLIGKARGEALIGEALIGRTLGKTLGKALGKTLRMAPRDNETMICSANADAAYGEEGCADVRSEAKRLLLKTGLDVDALHKPVSELSGGMRRRVAIVRALIVRPDFLFLDEPFTGLDGVARELTADIIKEITKAKTVIMVSHSEEDANLLDAKTLYLEKCN